MVRAKASRLWLTTPLNSGAIPNLVPNSIFLTFFSMARAYGTTTPSARKKTKAGVDINTLTMEQYLALARGNQAPGVVKPEIGGNVNFEIKSQFMLEFREDTFSGNKNKDDAVMLRVFPFTLTGAAKRWVDRLTPRAVNTWNLLKNAFIQRYCPPSKAAKQLEDIHNFKQEDDESLYQAWERYNDLMYKCPTRDINSHRKVNIFYKGLGTVNRQLLDSQGPIPGMTPAQALNTIQTMADHSQKWHDETSNGSVGSSNNTNRLAAIVSKLDNLGRYMKKLKENVHAIQVGCQIFKGPRLDKECPLNEEVKEVEEVKYGEFGRPAPFNGNNGANFRVCPPGYYTRIDNRSPYGEKRPSLEELMNKHQEESARRSTEMEVWIKKLQENAEINTRNQSASLKNLETQIEKLTKELHSRTTSGAPSSSTGECKAIYADQGAPINPTSSSKLNKLHGVSFLSNSNFQVKKEKPTKVLQCQLPPKELNPESSTLPCTIGNLNFYAMADLGRPFLATIHAEIDIFDKEISLGVGNDRIIFDMEKKDHNFTIPTAKILMVNSIREDEPNCPPDDPSLKSCKSDNLHDRFGDDVQEQQVKKKLRIDENILVKHFCKPIKQEYDRTIKTWPSCDPTKKD
ncbi:hypothetical protein Tco_0450371 [Tanacetum coccineum]